MKEYIITAAELFVLILCVGFFTSSETAYLSLPRLKLRNMVEQGRRNAKKVAALKANMDRLLTTVLIGTNFLNSLAIWRPAKPLLLSISSAQKRTFL